MEVIELTVLAGAVALIALTLWYFFGARAAVVAAVGDGGMQQVKINVKGGYSPSVIVAKRGRRLRLEFYRDETSSCSEQVVFGDFGIVRDLPAYQSTPIELTPERAGEFTFTCGMNMMRGKLVVED